MYSIRTRPVPRFLVVSSAVFPFSGEFMLRFLSAGAVLLAVASTATAAGRYVEVWNPPEARIGHPAGKGKVKTGRAALLAHGTSKIGTRRVAAPLAKAPTAEKHAVVDAARKAPNPRSIDIPRILTPEGNVLQVGTGQMSARVVR
jgi:type II secretory pathway component PulM